MIDKPPVSPQVQAQMGAPGGGPNFGPGIGEAMQQQGKSPISVAVSTVEKILMGVQDDNFQPYVQKAIAILKVGEAKATQQGPQSQPGAPSQPGMGGPPKPALPPSPGQMPG